MSLPLERWQEVAARRRAVCAVAPRTPARSWPAGFPCLRLSPLTWARGTRKCVGPGSRRTTPRSNPVYPNMRIREVSEPIRILKNTVIISLLDVGILKKRPVILYDLIQDNRRSLRTIVIQHNLVLNNDGSKSVKYSSVTKTTTYLVLLIQNLVQIM